MASVPTALSRALYSLLQARMLLLCLAPLLLALVLWALIAGFAWGPMMGWIDSGGSAELPWAGRVEPPQWMGGMMQLGGMLLLLALWVPALWVSVMVVAAVIAMPWMVGHVGRRDYPGLERLHGGTLLGSLGNALWASLVFVVLWLLTLPLWLLAGAGALAALLLTGWVTQRLLRYDALAEHASAAERQLVVERLGGRLWALGVVVSLLALLPLINLVLPVYAGLAVIHLCLAELAEVRGEGRVVA